MRKENREKLRENRVGAGERQNRRASQHCFQRVLASTTEAVAKINVTFKINTHFFKLCRVYTTLLKMLKCRRISQEWISWGSH